MLKKMFFMFLVAAALLLMGCQPQVVEVDVTRVITEIQEVEVEGEIVEVEVDHIVEEVSLDSASISTTPLPTQGATADRSAAQTSKRLIIKEGQLELLVDDSEKTIAEVNNLTAATGGFIVQQRVWDTNGYTYATIQLSVPVTEFERAMNVLRGLGEVTMDAAVGQDVTDEYIDLESRLGNLRATQERLRSFLESATKVEDVLEINKELTKVEGELSVILGRMNYLADRAAFSNIMLTINPRVPTPTPSPTPTMTPTATPTPVPEWRPGETARDASATLQTAGQETADFVIWNLIACGPWLVLLAILGYVALQAWRRFWGQPVTRVPQSQSHEENEEPPAS